MISFSLGMIYIFTLALFSSNNDDIFNDKLLEYHEFKDRLTTNSISTKYPGFFKHQLFMLDSDFFAQKSKIDLRFIQNYSFGKDQQI